MCVVSVLDHGGHVGPLTASILSHYNSRDPCVDRGAHEEKDGVKIVIEIVMLGLSLHHGLLTLFDVFVLPNNGAYFPRNRLNFSQLCVALYYLVLLLFLFEINIK